MWVGNLETSAESWANVMKRYFSFHQNSGGFRRKIGQFPWSKSFCASDRVFIGPENPEILPIFSGRPGTTEKVWKLRNEVRNSLVSWDTCLKKQSAKYAIPCALIHSAVFSRQITIIQLATKCRRYVNIVAIHAWFSNFLNFLNFVTLM